MGGSFRIRSVPWPEIVHRYEQLPWASGMLSLVTRIASSLYGEGGLYGATSMHTLLLAQTPEFQFRTDVLAVEQRGDRLVFSFSESEYDPPAWTRICAQDEGFDVLEHFLLDLKKWFR